MTNRDTLNRTPGEIVGPEPSDEREHFMQCPACGQWFDCRNLGDVLHHAELGHHPLPQQ